MFMMWLSEWMIASDFYCSCCIFLHFPKFQHRVYIAYIIVRKKRALRDREKKYEKKEPLLTIFNWAFLIPRLSQAPHPSPFSFCSLHVSIAFLLSHGMRKRNQLLHNVQFILCSQLLRNTKLLWKFTGLYISVFFDF